MANLTHPPTRFDLLDIMEGDLFYSFDLESMVEVYDGDIFIDFETANPPVSRDELFNLLPDWLAEEFAELLTRKGWSEGTNKGWSEGTSKGRSQEII